MDWLKHLIKTNPFLSLILPSLISGANFFGNLILYLRDGQLDSHELQSLMGSANGVQLIILAIIMIALKKEKK